MEAQELMISLQKKLEIEKRSQDYLLQVYNAKMTNDYPNMVASEGVYIPPTQNFIINPNQTSILSPIQQLLINLGTMLHPDDSNIVSEKLNEEQIKTLNQVFVKFTQDVNNLKFSTTNEFIDYTIKYIDKVNNNVNIINPVKVKQVRKPKIKIVPVPQTGTFDNSLQFFYDHFYSDPQWINEPEDAKIEYFLSVIQHYTDIELTYDSAQKFYEYIINYVLEPSNAIILKNYIKKWCNDENNGFRKGGKGSVLFTNDTLLPKTVKTPKITNSMYKQLVDLIIVELGVMNIPASKSGNGFKKGYGFKLKKNKSKPLKFGNGISDENFIKGHLFVELSKLNNNILCIKYVSTKNKRLDLAITDNTKIIILELLLKKFNIEHYEKLNEKEKKTISYFNHLFKLVDVKLLIDDPIEALYTKFNILRGEINASNDNPAIKTSLKETAFELHKYKKINSSQLRNLIFELEH